MQNVLTQIQELQQQVAEEKRKSWRNLLILGAIYGLMIPWVIWDTTNVMSQIKTVSSPANVAGLAANQVRIQLPQLQQELSAYLDRSALKMADRVVVSAHQSLPDITTWAKQRLTAASDQMTQDFNRRYVPNLTAFLKANLQDTVDSAHIASDADLNKAIVRATMGALDKELDQAINASMLSALGGIDADLNTLLHKADSELTLQQRAEKSAVLNALVLTKMAQNGDQSSLLAQGLRAILASILPGDMFKALNKPLS